MMDRSEWPIYWSPSKYDGAGIIYFSLIDDR
jgi:hypothetical protein